MIVLDANILVRAILGHRVRLILERYTAQSLQFCAAGASALFLIGVGPVCQVDELKEGAVGVRLDGDDMLLFFCAGFEE